MITQLYSSITEGLARVKNCSIYIEDVPQNFVPPFFLISFCSHNSSKGINGRLEHTVSVDVSYFPEAEVKKKEECWQMGETLTRDFSITEFRIKKRNFKIVDQVLHFTFDVRYREYENDDSIQMQDLIQQTGIREE